MTLRADKSRYWDGQRWVNTQPKQRPKPKAKPKPEAKKIPEKLKKKPAADIDNSTTKGDSESANEGYVSPEEYCMQ